MDWVGQGALIFSGMVCLLGIVCWAVSRFSKTDDSETIAHLERRVAEHRNLIIDLMEKVAALEKDIDSIEGHVFKLEKEANPIDWDAPIDIKSFFTSHTCSPEYLGQLDRQSGCSAE